MSLAALEVLRAQRAFQPLRTFDELPLYHVPFDDICGGTRHESALLRAVTERRRTTVIGRRGSGKSSLIATVLDPFGPLPDQFIPIRVPVATAAENVITDPGELARLVTRIVADSIGQLDDQTRETTRNRAAESVKTTLRPRRISGGLAIPGSVAKLQVDVREVVTEYTLTASAPELIAAAVDLFRTIRAHGVDPILILDDTDSWFADRAHLAVPFFDRTLRGVVAELDCPVVAAIHNSYLEIDGFDEARRAMFTATIEIPRLSLHQAGTAVGLIVSKALAVHEILEDPSAIFENGSLDVLAASYVDGLEMRDVERVLDHAVGVACDLGVESIDRRMMGQAALEERP